jgi:hypothetical protein
MTNETIRAILVGVALGIALWVFVPAEGSRNETTNDGPGVVIDLGDLVFLEPLPEPAAGPAVNWLLLGAGNPAGMAWRGWPGAPSRMSVGDAVSVGPGAGRVVLDPGAGYNPAADVGIVGATHYGAQFEGRAMGCPGAGPYRSADPTIAAIGAELVPCGTGLRVCGAAGGCIMVQRTDTCPGCGPTLIDLSEAGHAIVCGPGGGRCGVTVERIEQ